MSAAFGRSSGVMSSELLESVVRGQLNANTEGSAGSGGGLVLHSPAADRSSSGLFGGFDDEEEDQENLGLGGCVEAPKAVEGSADEDPTSLRSVLAALSQRSGKGVKRGRNADFEGTESKRPCGGEDEDGYSDVSSSTTLSGRAERGGCSPMAGGEKRALETSAELEETQQQAAKVARTSDVASCKRPLSSPPRDSIGLGGGAPVHKKRCVNPTEASLSSSRRMLRPVSLQQQVRLVGRVSIMLSFDLIQRKPSIRMVFR